MGATAETCGTPLVTADYIAWLLCSGREERAARLFAAHAGQLESANQAAVREQLAALVVAGNGDVLSWLPSDDPVVQNHAAATQRPCARIAWMTGQPRRRP